MLAEKYNKPADNGDINLNTPQHNVTKKKWRDIVPTLK